MSGDDQGGNLSVHAFRWHDGAKTNLGTLGGPESIVGFNNPINNSGVITGVSNTSTPDPNGEDFCGIGANCNNGLAGGINSRGQIVGVAETPNSDPCSFAFLQVEAVIWERGHVQELPPLPGDSIGNALANNDNGEVVGATGCMATNTVHAVLWLNGIPIDLGNLGSPAFNLAFGINNRGQVVGQSTLPDNTLHGFLWQNGVMNDLGSLPGLPGSEANGINNHGQVVGFSFDANADESSNVAWIWENGTMTDLNSLTPVGSPWFLMEALGINDRGQIAGKMFNLVSGDIHGFLATPVPGTSAKLSRALETPILPESVRQALQRKMTRHRSFGFRAPASNETGALQ